MRIVPPDELKKILADHKLWLNDRSKGRRADLRSVDLSFVDLRSVDLRSADLRFADLNFADLSSADLRSADLRFANLSSADLRSTRIHYQICPQIGSFLAFKKVRLIDANYKSTAVITIEIPAESKRLSCLSSRKCRAEKVKVIGVENLDGSPITSTTKLYSNRDPNFVYEIGKDIIADSFDLNPIEECSHGISFFVTKEEAMEYEF